MLLLLLLLLLLYLSLPGGEKWVWDDLICLTLGTYRCKKKRPRLFLSPFLFHLPTHTH